MLRPAFGLCVCLLALVSTARADDWPQWMGPGRDGIWQETGIIREFPKGGLPVAWRAEVGLGYSGPAVAAGRVYVMDYLLESGEITNNSGARDKLTGQERVLCFDAKDGTLLWKHAYARDYNLSFPGGPRCTPTVVGDKVYALGAEGNLWCLDAKKGQVVWSIDFVKDYGVTVPTWGVAAHPLVVDDTVYCVVGGEGSVAVAFDRLTGKEKWRALTSTEPGYCPPTMIEQAGVKQLLIWDAKALNSLNPQTGEVYWSRGTGTALRHGDRRSTSVERSTAGIELRSGSPLEARHRQADRRSAVAGKAQERRLLGQCHAHHRGRRRLWM